MSVTLEERLAERARYMAAVEEEQREGTPLALFRRLTGVYGVRLGDVTGAGRVRGMSPVPGGPPFVAGVTLHQGRLLPLVDLPVLWNQPYRGVFDLTSFMVLASGKLEVGVLVEQHLGLVEVAGGVSPWAGERLPGASGVAKHEGDVVTVLSATELLDAVTNAVGR